MLTLIISLERAVVNLLNKTSATIVPELEEKVTGKSAAAGKTVINQETRHMRRSLVMPVALICAALPSPAFALPTQPDARHEIQAAIRRGNASLHRKDIQGCLAGLTQDFQGEDVSGNHYGREQAKQNLLKFFSYAQSLTAQTLIKSIQIVKGQTIVVSHEQSALIIVGRRTHRLHTLVFDSLWRGVWIDTKAGWREQSEKQLTSTVTTDGVPRTIVPAGVKP